MPPVQYALRRPPLACLMAALPLLALAACGGGGGGVASTPTPPPTTTPPVTTTPPTQGEPPVTSTPTTSAPVTTPSAPTNYDTAEYRRSAGAVQASALTAYNAGFTGRGVTSAIVDGGIDTSNADFTGRISAASADVAGTRTIRDEGGHGTAVAGVLGAARNDSGPLGIAFETTLLIARSDTPGTCATSDGCKHADSAIARGVDLATTNRARVINLSLGGSPADATLSAAIGRATAAGIVVVIAAGNDASVDPDPLAQLANVDSAARGLVIIAGASNLAGDIATFSNRAGNGANHYLMALGERVQSYNQNGEQFLFNGTSFSAPLISGAVALLAQAFPNLTGQQIVQLLYSTATDLGTSGIDATYGRGLLNLTRAFQPQGATALAGSAVRVSLTGNGTLSTPMGDAGGTQAGASAVILDSYGRAYSYALGQSFTRPAPALRLAPALAGGIRNISLAADGTTVAMSVASRPGSEAVVERLLLAPDQARQVRTVAGFAAQRLGPQMAVAFGFAQGSATLAATLRGAGGDAFLIAGDPLATPGFERHAGTSFALRRAIGRLGVTVTAEGGDALAGTTTLGARPRDREYLPYSTLGLTIDRRFGPLALSGGMSRMQERDTVLGARFGAAFGGGGATTDFADATATLTPGGGWSISAAMRRGWTRMPGGGAATGGHLRSGGYAIDLARQGVFGVRDRIGLRFAQPLRVASGGYALMLPVAYDYATGTATLASSRLSLAPTGRERDAEASWAAPLLGGWLTTNLYWRRDPGHIAALPDDVGGAVRFAMGF